MARRVQIPLYRAKALQLHCSQILKIVKYDSANTRLVNALRLLKEDLRRLAILIHDTEDAKSDIGD